MKYFVLLSLLSFTLMASDYKVIEKRKSFNLNNALAKTSLTPKEFFDEFKKVASHQFYKDESDINYAMLNDFLVGIQDKDEKDIIISVEPNENYNRIKFHMYVKPSADGKVSHYKIAMDYNQDTSQKHIVKTVIDLRYGIVAKTAIKLFSSTGVLTQAVPEREIIRMIFDPESQSIIYDIYMKLVSPVDPDELDRKFDDAFEKIQKITAEKIIPVIENRLY